VPLPPIATSRQALHNAGQTLREKAQSDHITYSRTWLSQHTTADDDEEKPETATA
jgi:hypothetical protein